MKRKIIKLGQATYVASLPSKWIRENQLEKGDYLDVEEEDNSLVLRTKKKLKFSEARIDVTSYKNKNIGNILNQTYRKGFDKVHVKYKTQEQFNEISRLTRETLLGFDIVEQNENYCLLANIAEPGEDKFEVLLRKLFLSIKHEATEIIDELRKGNSSEMQKRNEIKNSIDKYTNIIRRMIIKYQIHGNKNSYLLFYSTSLLSLIHHAYYYMYKYAHDKDKLSKTTFGILDDSVKLFDEYYRAFYKKDLNITHDLIMKKVELVDKEGYKLLEKSKGHESVVLYHTLEAVRLIQMASTVIFGHVQEGEEK